MALSRLWRTREHLSVQCQVNFVLNLYGQVLFGPGREPFSPVRASDGIFRVIRRPEITNSRIDSLIL